jgi:iduronate 2-sulfatase
MCSHGWQLGEHSEWAKHTNFDITTHTPMLLHVPGVTDSPRMSRVTNAFSELVDAMPTLADFAGIPIPELCPVNPNCAGVGCSSAAVNVRLCTEGQSLRPIVEACGSGPGAQCDGAGKRATFSVYPHYGYNTPYHQVNGYTITTRLDSVEYRYTEWVPFDVDGSMQWWTPDYNPGRWEEVTEWCGDPHDPRHCNAARELYNHNADPEENTNLAELSSSLGVVQVLSAQLHAGWRQALMSSGH